MTINKIKIYIFIYTFSYLSNGFTSNIFCNDLFNKNIIKNPTLSTIKEFLPIWQDFLYQIKNFKQPIAHGTSSTEFLGIIKEGGLITGQIKSAFSKKYISLSDLNEKDGLLASYGFAIRNDWDELSVIAEPITNRDIVSRYADVNPLLKGFKGPLFRYFLRKAIKEYISIRGPNEGYPVYIVFDGENKVPVELVRPEQIPSELRTQEKVSTKFIRFIFVPAQRINQD
jgi:hypothetical protein